MDVAYSDCGVLHWTSEKLANSPKFGMCCYSRKIKVPKLDDPPPELLHLLVGQEDICKKFYDHICNYNNALAMTSLGCKVWYLLFSCFFARYNNNRAPNKYKFSRRLIKVRRKILKRAICLNFTVAFVLIVTFSIAFVAELTANEL